MGRTTNSNFRFIGTLLSVFVAVFLFGACVSARAQQQEVDSLLKELPRQKEDTNKVRVLKTLSYYYSAIDPDQGIKYGEAALALSRQLNWQKGVAMAANNIGTNYNNKSDFPKALEYYLIALKIWEEKGLKVSTAGSISNISTVYAGMGNYSKALEYGLRALAFYEETHHDEEAAGMYGTVGTYYEMSDSLEKALQYDLKSLELTAATGDSIGVATVSDNTGVVYARMGMFDKALQYGLRSLRIDRVEGNREGESVVLENIGNTYLAKYEAESKLAAGKRTDLTEALTYLNKSVDIAREMGLLSTLKDNYLILSKVYGALGDDKAALESYRHHIAIRDSVFSTDNKVKIANLETKREAELKEKQIQINKLAEGKKRNERIMFVAGILLLLVVVGTVSRSYAAQRKSNKVKTELLQQKDMLMREIHHRVKNNLQVITALLELQSGKLSDEGVKEAMAESTARVRSISLIHQKLYKDEHITTLELSNFIEDLMGQVAAAFKKPGQQITLNNYVPVCVVDIDTAVPLGLILNELMTNSFKYAFHDNEGYIEISLRKNEQYELTYKDSGPGLPTGLDVGKLKSLGMKVMHSLSKQLGGKLTYLADEKTFVISFKDEAGRRLTD